MKNLFNRLTLKHARFSKNKANGKKAAKKKDFLNAEVTPGQLFEHYQFLIRPEDILPNREKENRA